MLSVWPSLKFGHLVTELINHAVSYEGAMNKPTPAIALVDYFFVAHDSQLWFLERYTKIERLLLNHVIAYSSGSNIRARPDGTVVSVSDSLPGVYEFDPRSRRTFFPAYFRLSPLQKHVRKVVGGFGKKRCISMV